MHKFMNLELVKGSRSPSRLTQQFIIRKTSWGGEGWNGHRKRSRAKAELGTAGRTAIRWQAPQVSDRKSSGFWRQKLHCLHTLEYIHSILPLSALSLSRSSSLASAVTSDDVRGIYCLPKAPRQTQERQRRREDDEDDDKCGRFCDIDRKQKQTNCRCAVAYVNKKKEEKSHNILQIRLRWAGSVGKVLGRSTVSEKAETNEKKEITILS